MEFKYINIARDQNDIILFLKKPYRTKSTTNPTPKPQPKAKYYNYNI